MGVLSQGSEVRRAIQDQCSAVLPSASTLIAMDDHHHRLQPVEARIASMMTTLHRDQVTRIEMAVDRATHRIDLINFACVYPVFSPSVAANG